MRPRQFLIGVLPADWEWLAPLGLALLNGMGMLGILVGTLPAPIHALIGLAAALPLVWLSVAHVTNAHLRCRTSPALELSGALTMLALSITLLSGTSRFLLSPPPAWVIPLHRWSAVVTLVALALHVVLSPHRRR